ncbi:MAG: CPBP family intramembrane glutamic endopeptidase [Solirubrobacteraceae bacterium]
MLILIVIRRELGGLQWSRVREALWLRPPRDPRSGRVGGRVWWWVLPFFLLFGLVQFVPDIPGPSPRDFVEFVDSDRGEDFFRGAWGWFAVIVVLAVFNVVGEELLFRGLLLPRMHGVFARRDWIANGECQRNRVGMDESERHAHEEHAEQDRVGGRVRVRAGGSRSEPGGRAQRGAGGAPGRSPVAGVAGRRSGRSARALG